MQIQEPGPHHLSLATTPNWLVMVLGVLLVVIGSVVASFPGKATMLHLHRELPGQVAGSGSCELIEQTMFTTRRLVRIPLRLIDSAEVQAGNIGGRPSFYHLNLDVRDGQGAFYFTWYGSGIAAHADAARVNAFLAKPGLGDLTITNDKRPFYYPMGGTLVFAGIVLLFWGSLSLQVLFDRARRQVRVTRQGLLGTIVDEYPFGEISDFHVAGIGGDCQLFLVLVSGRKVALTSSTDMQNMVGPRAIRRIRLDEAERLRVFMQDPTPGA